MNPTPTKKAPAMEQGPWFLEEGSKGGWFSRWCDLVLGGETSTGWWWNSGGVVVVLSIGVGFWSQYPHKSPLPA